MKEISLEQFQLEIFLCYYSQNNIPSFVDFLEQKTEKKLEDISFACYLDYIVDRVNKEDWISEEEFFSSDKYNAK